MREAMNRAAVPPDVAADMEVAVGEVLSNIHEAYGSRIGPVNVDILLTAVAVSAVVTDRRDAATAPLIPRSVPADSGGNGLYLAVRLVDNVEIRRNPAGKGVSIRMATCVDPEPIGGVRGPDARTFARADGFAKPLAGARPGSSLEKAMAHLR